MTFKEDKSPTLDELVPQVVAAIEERDRYRTLLSQQTIVSSELLDYLSKMDSQVGEICQVLGLTKDADLPSLKNKVNETAQELQTKIGKLARAYEKISSFESTVQHYRSIMGSIQSSLGTINSEIFTRALSVSTTEEVKESVESVCDQLNDYYASLKIHSEEKEEILCLLKNIVGCPESESLRKYLRMTGNVKNEIIVEALRKKVIEQEEKKKAEEKLKELKSKDIEGIISKGLMEKRWIKPLAWSAAVMIFGGIIWKGVNYYDGKAETVNEEIIIDAQREVASQDAPAATPGTAADTPIPYTMRILTEGHVPDSKEYNLNFSNFGEIELTAFSSARLSLSTSIKDLLDCTISCKDNHTKIQLKESKELYLIDYCGEITTPEELTLEVKCRQIQANSPEKIALATIQIYEQTEPAAPPPSEENNNGGDIPADVPAITLKIDKFECPSTINRGKLSDKENVCQYMVSEKSERQKISCTIGCNGHEELLEVKKSEKSEKRLSHLCMKEEAILTLGMKCQYASGGWTNLIEQKVTVNPIKVQEGYAFKKAPKSDKVPSAPTNNASAASQLQEKEDTPRRNACGYEITREGFNRANWGEYQCIIFSSKEEKARLINITKTNYDLIDGKNVPLPTGCMIGTKEYSSNKIIKDNNLTSCALCCPPGAFKK